MSKAEKINQARMEFQLFQCFGSKSSYSYAHPNDIVIFNSYVLFKDEDGMLQKVSSFGDLNLSQEETINKIKKLCLVCECSLRIYRESTVHNEVFNGNIFPYEEYTASFEFNKRTQSVDFVIK